MKIISQLTGLCLFALLWVFNSTAQGSEHEYREHGAHEHGAAILNIAIESNSLHLELESPAMNIVGFEHAPKNHEQEHAVKHAVSELRKGNTLFILPAAAQCHLAEVEVESPLLETDQHEHKDDHKPDKHKEEHSERHSEFHAAYVFQCKNINALNEIDVQLFNKFKGTEELRVQLISAKGQTVKELTAKQHKLVF